MVLSLFIAIQPTKILKNCLSMKSSPCFFCLPAEKVFHAKSAKSAESLSSFLFHAFAGGSQTSLRQESAESLSTPSPLRGTTPVSGVERTPSIPLQGEESVTTDLCPHHTDCPSETGGRGAKRRRGWIVFRFDLTYRRPLVHFSVFHSLKRWGWMVSVSVSVSVLPLRPLREIKISM